MKFATTLVGFLTIAFGNASPVTYPGQPCPPGSCGVQGFETRYANPFYVSDDPGLYSEKACGEACAAFDGCETYALGRETCRLYNQPE